MNVDFLGRSAPDAARVLEVPNQLFLLGIDADDGIASPQEGALLLLDVAELRIPVGVRRPREPLPVALE
jgi:hypothetical protein